MLRVLPRITRRTISLNRCLKSSSSCVLNKKEEIQPGENESSQPKSPQLKSPYLAELSSSAGLRKLKIAERSFGEQLEPAGESTSNLNQSRSTSNLKQSRSTINSNARQPEDHLKTNEQTNDLNEGESTTNSNASEQTSNSNTSQSTIDSNVSEYDTVEDWLSSIRLQLVDMSLAELNTVYVRMMALFRRQEAAMRVDTQECKKELMKSPDYWQLIDRTKSSMSKLSNVMLINLLRWFSMTGESTQSPLYLDTCEQIHGRADRLEMSASELVEALFVMHFHRDGPFADQRLVQAARRQLLNSKPIETVDTIDTTTKAIFLFLMPGYDADHRVTKRLIASLLSREVQLTYRQSVMLLRRVKQSSELNSSEIRRNQASKTYRRFTEEGRIKFRKKSGDFRHFPNKLAGLIDKCNDIIHRELTEQPTDENFDFFLSYLHDSVDPINHEFSNFYALNLFAPVRDFLLTREAESPEVQRRYDLVLYNLVMNYYKLRTYFDESLLRRLYELVCSSEQLPGELTNPVPFYFLISKYRLPWVQHDLLASRLFGGVIESNSELSRAARLLGELILNDVQDVRVLHYVCDQIQKLSSHAVSTNEYKLIALARVYFSMFGRLRSDQKAKIERKLNQIIFDYTGNKPKLSEKYIRFADSKVQKNGFLSNGMYVKGFGIYDRNKNDFVSLADREKYFNRVDRMPMEKHQQLFLILECNRLKGDIGQYESIYNYQMKRVLERMKIKSMEVIKEDFQQLPFNEQALYLVRKAKAFYGID